jgi:hypothetical protein
VPLCLAFSCKESFLGPLPWRPRGQFCRRHGIVIQAHPRATVSTFCADFAPDGSGRQGLEHRRFCGAYACNLVVVRVVLVDACNLDTVHSLDERLGRSRLSVATVGLLVGLVVRVIVLGGNGGGVRLCTLSGLRPLKIEAENELHLSASRLLAWGPAHPACYILEEIEWTGILELGHPLVCGWSG